MKNTIAIVTGGSQGIGFAVAEEIIRQGGKVLLADINETTGAASAQTLGENCAFVKHNVSDEESWKHVFECVKETFGTVNVLVNCAGITGEASDVEHESLDDWNKVFSVNAIGPFLGIKHAMANMNEGGSVVNVCALAGIYAEPVAVAYSASKGAERMLTKSAALYGAGKEHVIRVNAVHPGPVNTPMVKQITELQPEVMAAQIAKVPMGKFAEPEDVAKMVAFLASDKASHITGGDFIVDGGTSAGF